jgi:AraC family transcriptional regulator of adaptative response/methylated-DNA-[protein]-cysteine methyltransferase
MAKPVQNERHSIAQHSTTPAPIETSLAAWPEAQADRYWTAVMNRDETQDGVFVYGVRSTHIYCRPSCPSRRPKQEGTVFFKSGTEARAAGFRPCRRCQPDLAVTDEVAWVKQVCSLIDANLGGITTLDYLGLELNISPGYLQKVFKRVMGITPRQYAEARRRERFKTTLKQASTITESIFEAGYGSHSSAYEGKSIGMSPKDYQKGGHGQTIQFTIQRCSLGFVLVAATERGVCSIRLGDTPGALEGELRDEFSNAILIEAPTTNHETRIEAADGPSAEAGRAKSGLEHYAKVAIQAVEGQTRPEELPLDIKATAFQERVWRALREIPVGETRTYSQVAAAIGQPAATRAVAHACATNPVAVVVPCHRVIRTDGSLGGYRWGLERKEALLTREQALKASIEHSEVETSST